MLIPSVLDDLLNTSVATTTRPKAAVRVSKSEEEMLVQILVPGYSQSDLEISYLEDMLEVKGNKLREVDETSNEEAGVEGKSEKLLYSEFKIDSAFRRTIELPVAINPEGAQAKLENGILSVRLPIKEAAKPKIIALQ